MFYACSKAAVTAVKVELHLSAGISLLKSNIGQYGGCYAKDMPETTLLWYSGVIQLHRPSRIEVLGMRSSEAEVVCFDNKLIG